jgi:hypothetical protein
MTLWKLITLWIMSVGILGGFHHLVDRRNHGPAATRAWNFRKGLKSSIYSLAITRLFLCGCKRTIWREAIVCRLSSFFTLTKLSVVLSKTSATTKSSRVLMIGVAPENRKGFSTLFAYKGNGWVLFLRHSNCTHYKSGYAWRQLWLGQVRAHGLWARSSSGDL